MSNLDLPPIRLVIFDLGGTIVDHGCQAPVRAFIDAFRRAGIEVTAEQARGPMGMAKIDHVRELFKLEAIAEQWRSKLNRDWNEDDVVKTYDNFLPLQIELGQQHTDIIPGTDACFKTCQGQGIAIGATTGYPRSVADPIVATLEQAGLKFDAYVCTDEVDAGRPAPDMIKEVMRRVGIDDVRSVVNVGDTTPDMQSASSANVWAVGIAETGSEFGLTAEELAACPEEDRAAKYAAAAAKLKEAGAHAIIRSPQELPQLIESGNFRS